MQEYRAAERLYVTADGRVVGHDSPDKERLLVAAGQVIPAALVRQYGLAPDDDSQPTAIRAPRKAVAAPAHDKAQHGPVRTKAAPPTEAPAHD